MPIQTGPQDMHKEATLRPSLLIRDVQCFLTISENQNSKFGSKTQIEQGLFYLLCKICMNRPLLKLDPSLSFLPISKAWSLMRNECF